MRIASFPGAILTAMAVWFLPLTQQAQAPDTRPSVMVAGKKMTYSSFGLATRRPGSPVLIFEAGFGASGSNSFKDLYPQLSKGMEGMAGIGYDRNGEGGSGEDSTLPTDGDLIRRLHAFLEAVKVPPPYILIGHSMGGPYIRLFTAVYPKEVAGLVFLDPPDFMLTTGQNEQIKTITHSETGAQSGWIGSLDGTAADTLWGPLVRHRNKRLAALFRQGIFEEYHHLPPLPDIPVAILLSIDKPYKPGTHTPAELEKFRVADRFRIENYTAMIDNNHHSGLLLLPGYGHFLHTEDAALVVAAIKRVYRAVITGTGSGKQ